MILFTHAAILVILFYIVWTGKKQKISFFTADDTDGLGELLCGLEILTPQHSKYLIMARTPTSVQPNYYK